MASACGLWSESGRTGRLGGGSSPVQHLGQDTRFLIWQKGLIIPSALLPCLPPSEGTPNGQKWDSHPWTPCQEQAISCLPQAGMEAGIHT